jgi:SSS family solute:Na+ symporter
MHAIDYVVVAAYLVAMVWLGYFVGRRVSSFREYFVVAGRLTTPLLICSLVSTYYGLDVLFGASEVAYREGLVAYTVYSRPYYLFILLTAFFIARRLKQYDFISLPDVIGHFYGNPARIVSAVACFFYALPTASLMGMGVLVDVLFGVPYVWAVVIGASISLLYTAMGGLLADSLTDTVQFVLMCVMLALAACFGLQRIGGFETLVERLPPTFFASTGDYPTQTILVFALAGMSAMVDPGFYQRIFAAESYRSVVWALILGIALWSAFDWVTTIMGMVARVSDIPIAEPRYALLETTLAVLPAGLSGLFAVAVLAAAMSTIDSYLLIAGGNVAYDIYRPLSKRQLTDDQQLRLTRWGIVGATLLTIVFAIFFQSIVSAWVWMATILLSSSLVPVLAGLYLPKPHPARAGLFATVGGFGSAILFYGFVNVCGAYSEEWDTTIVEVAVGGRPLEIWQDHALLVTLPISILGYAVGHFSSRRSH